MANADDAITFVLSNEGGFVDNPNDAGGTTNFGLSLRFLRQIPENRLRKCGIFLPPPPMDLKEIKDLTIDQARWIYSDEFWERTPYEKIENQSIANYVFDMAVQHGESQAIKLLQRALWAVRSQKYFVLDDGVLGEKTIVAVNLLTTTFVPLEASLQSALMAERAGYMRLLCVENPKNKEFLDGWLNRCYRI